MQALHQAFITENHFFERVRCGQHGGDELGADCRLGGA